MKSDMNNETLPHVSAVVDGMLDIQGKTMVSLCKVLNKLTQDAYESKLSESFWKDHEEELSDLSVKLDLAKEEVVIIAVMCEFGAPLSWWQLASFFGIPRLEMMSYNPVMESLKRKRWIVSCPVYKSHGSCDGFRLMPGVVRDMRENRPFIPERISGLTEQQFVERIGRFMSKEALDGSLDEKEKQRLLFQIMEANPHLPICKKCMELEDDGARLVLLMVVGYLERSDDTVTPGILIPQIMNWFNEHWKPSALFDSLRDRSNELFRHNLVQYRVEDGYVNSNILCLTSYARHCLLPNYCKKFDPSNDQVCKIIKHASIKKQGLFFSCDDFQKIDCLGSLLMKDIFSVFRKKLCKSNLDRGVAALLYGPKGTGKSHVVLQLARESGRNVMKVDMADLKDSFLADRENILKGVFTHYRHLCDSSKVTPILLLEDIEYLFGVKSESSEAIDASMACTLLDILLKGIEMQEGILIVTSNVSTGLNPMLERQFIVKVGLSCPAPAERKMIWKYMKPNLNLDECALLADTFDLNGGEIERVVKKGKVKELLSGYPPTLSDLQYFSEELISEREEESQ